MHKLESILLMTSVAVEKGKIGKVKLSKALERLASVSSNYEPIPYEAGPFLDGEAELDEMWQEWGRRYGHLMHE